ncbi:MAG: insulinase family protein, partial [Eubacterium sp.]
MVNSNILERNKKLNNLSQYEVLRHDIIEELESDAWLLRHKKSGARLALLSNDDDNKVFNIGFRTPVDNDTGIAHCMEHSVLCGSRHFPVKDPFIELAKGSLNTFLNAMTYPDKTVYPVASCNDKDFQNLMHVYLDAVFYPNIYEHEEIFMQEAWHYELDNPEDDLKINGVVYSEMKGAFSAVDSVHERMVLHSLFPDITYKNESGGNPDNIPDLTYEDFLEFHKCYYHPVNSYICLYGDMDMIEKLEWLDREYLSKFDKIDIKSEIELQKPFNKMQIEKTSYSITQKESLENNSMISYNAVIGTSLDKNLSYAFQVLDYALMSMPGAPLKQAILDASIGSDVYGIYDNGIRQPFYAITAKNANEKDAEKLVEVIKQCLNKIIKTGLDKKSLEAGLNSLEFKYREADYGRYPKGLMYVLEMFDSWLYDENEPFMHLKTNETFQFLHESIDTGYYENIIKEYLINNTHTSLVIITPERGLTAQREEQLANRLSEYKNGLNEKQIYDIINKTIKLRKYQEEPSSLEELETIPILDVSDIKKEARPITYKLSNIKDIPVCYTDIFTNGIGYVNLSFNCNDLRTDLIPYVGLLKSVLGFMDNESYSYSDFANEVNINMG